MGLSSRRVGGRISEKYDVLDGDATIGIFVNAGEPANEEAAIGVGAKMKLEATAQKPASLTYQGGFRLVRRIGCMALEGANEFSPLPDLGPLETILREIEGTLAAKLFYSAIMMVLALPDICAALSSSDGQTCGQRYRDWYDRNLASRIPLLTSNDAYRLRCGVVHQGRFGHPRMQYARVVFVPPSDQPGFTTMSLHHCIFDDTLILNPNLFCAEIMAGVRDWFVREGMAAEIQKNLPQIMAYRWNLGRTIGGKVLVIS